MPLDFDTKLYSQCLNKSLIDSGTHFPIQLWFLKGFCYKIAFHGHQATISHLNDRVKIEGFIIAASKY